MKAAGEAILLVYGKSSPPAERDKLFLHPVLSLRRGIAHAPVEVPLDGGNSDGSNGGEHKGPACASIGHVRLLLLIGEWLVGTRIGLDDGMLLILLQYNG